ncbi:OmpA family protein [Edaphocola aurantiacus]|uniref:OmpA family protein n=1 Tax=Edaphocola aurantiacus TaxID=2601682 RepID=UPI001C949205|nr:DUF5723 family protein [Edaphocola aurantiacus]
MMKKCTLTLLALAALTPTLTAQHYLGVATGNYLPTKSVFLNPALLSDSRVKWSIDVISVNGGIDQNYGTINSSNIFNKLLNDDKNYNIGDIVTKGDRQKFDINGPLVSVNVLNIYASFKDKHNFALTNRVRFANQLRDYNSAFFNTIFSSNNGNIAVNAQNMNFNINAWTETGLSYATNLFTKPTSSLSLGVSLRYLSGIGYGGNSIQSIVGNYNESNKTITVQSMSLNASTNLYNSNILNGNFNDLFNSMFSGKSSGIGGDIGLVYQWAPDAAKYTYEMDGSPNRRNPEKDIYKLRFSASVIDIGAIAYKDSRNYGVSGIGTLNVDSLGDKFNNYDELKSYMASRGFTVNDGAATRTRINMPTSLVLGADWNIKNGFYANATFIGSLMKPAYDNYSPYNFSQLTITPRYENKILTVGLPLTYNFTSESMKAGLGIRVSGLYFGTDDGLALLGGNSAKGANFYFGLQVPFHKKKLKDSDGDKVSNKLDKCPGEAGIWANMGCKPTDRDNDGVVDSVDKCPDVAGLANTQGCPDADLDGIADGEDLCPNEAGTVATNGCPDRDGDGIADKDDKCPDIAGLAQFQGCSDTDGDGIADWEDKCPNNAGPIAQQGCPDSDNDGIADHLDKCPTVPGTVNNHGCPEIRAEVKKRLAFAATAIQFETGKAVIKKTSYKLLDEIVSILNEYTDYNMTIDGHTDNVGTAERNLELSKQRAAAVKEYFVSKGIAEGRLSTNGYGLEKPKASNKTAAGRAQNRRVEMDLKLAD